MVRDVQQFSPVFVSLVNFVPESVVYPLMRLARLSLPVSDGLIIRIGGSGGRGFSKDRRQPPLGRGRGCCARGGGRGGGRVRGVIKRFFVRARFRALDPVSHTIVDIFFLVVVTINIIFIFIITTTFIAVISIVIVDVVIVVIIVIFIVTRVEIAKGGVAMPCDTLSLVLPLYLAVAFATVLASTLTLALALVLLLCRL